MFKKVAIGTIAAAVLATSVSLPNLYAQAAPAPLNPQGTLKPEPFADVPPDHWAYNAVEFLRQQGLTEGYPDRTFKGKRPMTRYEFAQTLARMIPGILAQANKGVPAVAGVTQEQLNEAIQGVKNQILTPEQVREIVRQELEKQPKPAPGVTPEQLATLQRLVNEFRDELARLGVDVDALKRELADLRGRVEAIEAELRRMPKVIGDANVIGKGAWKSGQVATAVPGVFRPVLDHDGRPLPETTNLITGLAPYYDLDLGVVACPNNDVRVGAVLNVGNYVSSYVNPLFHDYVTGNDTVTPYKVFISVPFRFLGTNDVTVGRQGMQLTPFVFKAIDPDTYTYLPREDSGEVVAWGINTNWRFGSAKVRAFAGLNPLDGRLLPLNFYPDLGGLSTVLGSNNGVGTVDGGTAPIQTIRNFAGARLTFGEPDLLPYRAQELPVGTATQLNATLVNPVATAATNAGVETPAVESGLNWGPFRNAVIGASWLIATGDRPRAVEDSRAQVFGADGQFGIGPIRIQGEWGFGQSQVGGAPTPRARALDNQAWDVRGFWNLGLGSIADLSIGGGFRNIELGYVTPGYWGTLGDWKNPRGIAGPIAEIRMPFKQVFAPFLRNFTLIGSGEWYAGERNLTTVGTTAANDPAEKNLHIDRYLAGVQFGLTSRDTVDLGFEQIFRNYVPTLATDAPLALPTMGVAGSPLVGTRIKNTETYINFGIGHNFTPDVAMKLLYQLVDFEKFAVDNSNQPANYRGYVATAQVGVRF